MKLFTNLLNYNFSSATTSFPAGRQNIEDTTLYENSLFVENSGHSGTATEGFSSSSSESGIDQHNNNCSRHHSNNTRRTSLRPRLPAPPCFDGYQVDMGGRGSKGGLEVKEVKVNSLIYCCCRHLCSVLNRSLFIVIIFRFARSVARIRRMCPSSSRT